MSGVGRKSGLTSYMN